MHASLIVKEMSQTTGRQINTIRMASDTTTVCHINGIFNLPSRYEVEIIRMST